ncbi:MAG: diphthamide biosynthesis enzyme Dph2 [Thermoplasmatota archaeon]
MTAEPFPSFAVDIDGIVELIKGRGYERILLQVPEGLKRGALELSRRIERETKAKAFIDGEHCYGACDHSGTRAKLLGLDAVVHLGHADIPHMESECSTPVHYFITPMKLNTAPLIKGLERIVGEAGVNAFGIASTVQHLELLGPAGQYLESIGRTFLIGGAGRREEYPGQVLGCSFRSPRRISDEVEAFIYIGTGRFHPIGMVSAVKKPVWAVDPMTGDVTIYGQNDLDIFLRRRFGAITKAKESIEKGGVIGIVVGTKPGQMRKELSEKALRACEGGGATASLIVMDHIEPMKLRSLGIEVAVITACPRIAYDDSPRFLEEGIVVLTVNELMIALGNDEWESYVFDEEW